MNILNKFLFLVLYNYTILHFLQLKYNRYVNRKRIKKEDER